MGKALGGASGGFTSGRKEIIALLRQRSRPYPFSNTLAPAVVGAGLRTIDLLSSSAELREKLEGNTRYFREAMTAKGFQIKEGTHPIVPIMLGDARLAQDMASELLEGGIYVIGFSYPVVPKGKARIAYRFLPPTSESTSTGRSMPLPRLAAAADHCLDGRCVPAPS